MTDSQHQDSSSFAKDETRPCGLLRKNQIDDDQKKTKRQKSKRSIRRLTDEGDSLPPPSGASRRTAQPNRIGQEVHLEGSQAVSGGQEEHTSVAGRVGATAVPDTSGTRNDESASQQPAQAITTELRVEMVQKSRAKRPAEMSGHVRQEIHAEMHGQKRQKPQSKMNAQVVDAQVANVEYQLRKELRAELYSKTLRELQEEQKLGPNSEDEHVKELGHINELGQVLEDDEEETHDGEQNNVWNAVETQQNADEYDVEAQPTSTKEGGSFGSRKRRMIFAAITLVVLVGISVGVTVSLVSKDTSSGSSGSQGDTVPGNLVPTPSPTPPADTTPLPVEPPGSPTATPAEPTQPASPTAFPVTSPPSPPSPAPTFSPGTALYDGSPIDVDASLGSTVAMSADGRTVAVSTPSSRTVQVYRKQVQDFNWKLVGEISDSDGSIPPDDDPMEQVVNNTENNETLGDFGHLMAMSRDGKWLAIGGEAYVRVYYVNEDAFDVNKNALEPRGTIPAEPQSLDISSGSQKPRCAIASTNSVRVYVFNGTSGWIPSPDLELPDGTPERKSISMSSNGRYIGLGLPADGDEKAQVAVYKYKYVDKEWRQNAVFAKEIESASGDKSPPSLSMSGDERTVVFGFLEPSEPAEEAAKTRGRVQVYRNLSKHPNRHDWQLISDDSEDRWYGVSDSNQLVSISNDGNVVAFYSHPVTVMEFEADSGWKLRVNGTQADIEISDALFLSGNGRRLALSANCKVHVFEIPENTPGPTASPTTTMLSSSPT